MFFCYTNTNGCVRLNNSITDSAPSDYLHRRSQMFRHMVLSMHVPVFVRPVCACVRAHVYVCVYVQEHTRRPV